MTRERIEDMREVVLPFVKKRLLETNYENLGKSDAEEFAREFNEILNLAIKALEQEPILDKIRTEIENIDTSYYNSVNEVDMTECADDIKHGILEIIDKYKSESEG